MIGHYTPTNSGPRKLDQNYGLARRFEMNYNELVDRQEFLEIKYHLTKQEAYEAACYDRDPETWEGSRWEIVEPRENT